MRRRISPLTALSFISLVTGGLGCSAPSGDPVGTSRAALTETGAPDCQRPTVELCQDPTYLRSECGQYYAAECSLILRGCPAPTLEQCQDPAYVRSECGQLRLRDCEGLTGGCPLPTPAQCQHTGYLQTECGKMYAEECAQSLKPAVQAYLDSIPTKRKMYLISKPTDSFNLKEGPYTPHIPAKLTLPNDLTFSSQYQTVTSAFRQSGPTDDSQAAAQAASIFHRHPEWETNGPNHDGQGVGSCEEYVYEKYYDFSRYQDAVTACGGDWECIYKITYWTTRPGISKRVLKRKDGAKIDAVPETNPYEDIVALGKDAPKNPFHRAGGSVMKGIAAKFPNHPHVAALAAVLTDGQHYWNSGLAGADRIKHATDWDLQAFQHAKVTNVSVEEFEEFARRTGKVDQLFETYANALKGAGSCPMSPGGDIFGTGGSSSGTLTPYIPSGGLAPVTGISIGGTGGLTPYIPNAGSGIVTVPVVSASTFEGLLSGGTSVAGAVDATCDRAGWEYAIPDVASLVPAATDEPQLVCPADKPGDSATTLKRNAGCRYVNALLEEWNRLKRGGGGCYDGSFYGCDWLPQRFVDRYAAHDLYGLQRYQEYVDCVRYTGNSFSEQPTLNHAATLITQLKQAAPSLEANAKMFSPGKFGQIFTAGEEWGEPDYITAGYEAYAGWGLEVLEVTKGNVDPAKNNVPCRMGGFARGQIKAHASSIVDPYINAYSTVKDPLGIPWAKRWNELVDAELWGTVGELRGSFKDGDDKQWDGPAWPTSTKQGEWPVPVMDSKARGRVFLKLAGEQILDEYGEFSLNQAYTKALVDETYNTPKMVVDFWIGPVPVTMSGWGVVKYGVTFNASAALPTACEYPPKLYKLEASLAPWVRAEALAQAGIGLSSLASGGVRGSVVLLAAKLPVTSHAALIATGQNQFGLELGVGGTLSGRTLDGRLALYAEVFGETVWEHEIFRWNGYKFDEGLFNVKTTVPLGGFPVVLP